MKATLRFVLLWLGCWGLSKQEAQAQCPANATVTLNLGSRNGEDWDAATAPDLANPIASNVGGTPTDVTSGSFTSLSSPDSYLQVRRSGGLLGLGDEPRLLDYNTLEWFANYTSNTSKSSLVTFAFSRPLDNYSITLQDIDRVAGANPGFIDVVRLDGYDVNGNIVSLPASSFVYTAGSQTVAGNTVTGAADINNNSSTSGLVIVNFPVPITRLVLTYSNGSTNSNPSQQAIGISQMSWCKATPVANNDSRDVPLNTAVNGNVVLNDTDADQNPFTASLIDSPLHGTVAFNADGTYRYTPTTSYTGPDSFTYRICNSNSTATLCSSTATVNLRVYSTNTACTSASGSNLLQNADFNAGNTGFKTTYRYVSSKYAAGNTTSGVYPEGTYTVDASATPYHPGFQGTGHTPNVANDKFLIVNGALDIRTLYSQTVTVQPNRYYTFSAFFNNLLPPGPLQGVPEVGFVINGESVSGTIRAEQTPDAWFSFSDIWFSGNNTSATFEIRNVSTVVGGNDLAVDDVYFGSCNLAPTAVADAATTAPNTASLVSILANDLDPDNNNLFAPATIDIDPTLEGVQSTRTITGEGTFTVNTSTGVVTFAPVANFMGTSVTSYVVQDVSGAPTNAANLVVTVQQPTADLVVSLLAPANNATVTAGQPVTFTVQTSNNGASTASNVAPTVQLPAGLTGSGTNGTLTFSNGGSYNNATGLVTFPVASSLLNGSSVTHSLTFFAPSTGPFTGSANVAANTADAKSADNTASITVNVASAFDLSTTISSPATVGVGTPLTFSVITRNTGPAPATGVVQTVSLPGKRTRLFITNNGTYAYDATANTTVVTFPAINIPAGQSHNNTISLQVPTVGTFTATATVPTIGGETNTGNNSATTSTVLSQVTEAATNVYSTFTATSNGTPVANVAAGAPLTLTLTSGNAGATAVSAAHPRLSLPADLDPATVVVSNGGSYDPLTGIVSWSNPLSLASGSAVVNTVQLPAPGYGPLLVHATTTTTAPDPVPADNSAASMLTINPTADVVSTMTGPATATAGQRITYTVTTTNRGLMPATNVQQFVQVPPAVANFSYTKNVLPNSVGELDVQPNQTLLAYPVISVLAPGQSVTNTVTFDAPAATFPVTAFAITTSPDNTPANNTSSITVVNTAASDVVATIAGPATAVSGTPVVYSVEVRNNGTSPAASVATAVHLPTGLSSVVVRDAAGVAISNAYNSITGVVTLPARTNMVVGASGAGLNTITFAAPDVAAITATAVASVTSATNDLSRANNTATASTSVVRSTATVDMATTIRANVASQVTGQPVTFSVTTTNYGPVTATSVVQRVALPALLDPATVEVSNGGIYTPATGIVSWSYASQAVGTANAITSTIRVTAPGTGPLTAVASVGSDSNDGASTTNTEVASVSVTPVMNLRSIVRGPSAASSAQIGSVVAGQPVTYLLRAVNDGPSPAQGVGFTARIPAGLDATTVAVSGGGTYVPATGDVTFPAIGTLQAGHNASAAYTVTFPAPAGVASYPVTATLTSSSAQTGTSDDSQTYTTNLGNLAPVANTFVNSLTAPDGNTADSYLRLSPLSARDADGAIASFTITSVPDAATQGTLYFSADGTTFAPVAAGRSIPATDADKLYFRPYSDPTDPLNNNDQNFVGNASFTYTATDSYPLPGVSAAARYVLPVGQDNKAVFTAGPVKGGDNPYQEGDVLTSAFDLNGGEYRGSDVTDTGVRSAALAPGSNALPAGTILNATTGTVTVANRLLLAAGNYAVTVATTDELGGVTTQPVNFTIGARPLPVTLIGFDAIAKGRDALLTWATATEKNNVGFDVERSVDGRRFEKVGTVDGRGNSTSRQQYSFVDGKAAAVASTVYYRLKQLDVDGTTNYTPIQVVAFGPAKGTLQLTLHPNPASSELHLTLTAPLQKGQVTVYSAIGSLVMTKNLDGALGTTLDVSALPKGTYLLKVVGENSQPQTRRFVKN